MPVPNDLNDRIAEAKGWVWRYVRSAVCAWVGCNKLAGPDDCDACDLVMEGPQPWAARACLSIEWTDPKGISHLRPDFTGTLEGVAGMLWELGDWEWLPMTKERAWYLPVQDQITENWICLPHQQVRPIFISPLDRPGDCVGEAYMSVFGEEAADGQE